MFRKRGSDPAFGSDSFLDVLANLVGILIVVIVLVGAQVRRLPAPLPPPPPSVAAPSPGPDEAPLRAAEADLAEARRQVAALQQRLFELMGHLDLAKSAKDEAVLLMEQLESARTAALQEREAVRQQTAAAASAVQQQAALLQTREAELVLLRQRIEQLEKSIREAEATPPERRLLRYQAPVSRAVGTGELIFELKNDRISFVDLEALIGQVKKSLPEKMELLRTRWEWTETTAPVGAYKLRYTLVRDRSSLLDQAFAGLPPAHDTSFSVSVARWEIVPLYTPRGETLAEALAEDSRFRAIVDAVSPAEAVLTFAVYPESFETFRRLRDLLHARGFVVAGRPLPADVPISGSRHGSMSLGQ